VPLHCRVDSRPSPAGIAPVGDPAKDFPVIVQDGKIRSNLRN
jgi:hypothetical protein